MAYPECVDLPQGFPTSATVKLQSTRFGNNWGWSAPFAHGDAQYRLVLSRFSGMPPAGETEVRLLGILETRPSDILCRT